MTRSDEILEGLARGRNDPEFFWQFFLGRTPHSGQLKYELEAEATINVLACANRWGKTTLLSGRHFRRNIYKIGGEPKYHVLNPASGLYEFDFKKFSRLRYNTIHAAGDWDTAKLVWDEAHKLRDENPRLKAFVPEAPKSLPPHMDFLHGARWKFRTLGDNASGIDGNSFYLVSVDEAGWIKGLEQMHNNVIRVRVADVRGIVDYVGTFKPGVSKDFYKFAVRASARTGAGIAFDHRGETDDDSEGGTLDAAIRRYLSEFGIDLDEYEDAMARAQAEAGLALSPTAAT